MEANLIHLVKEEGIEKNPPVSLTLLSQTKASQMSFDHASALAMAVTKATGVEIAFQYNLTTDKVVTPIVAGGTEGVISPEANNPSYPLGDFHTHPIGTTCLFSVFDQLRYFANKNKFTEVSLGCPDKGNLIRRNTLSPDWMQNGEMRGTPQGNEKQFNAFPQNNYWLNNGIHRTAPKGQGNRPD